MNQVQFIPGTQIEFRLHAEWKDLVDAIKNRTKFNNIYPYVFSDKMIYLIIHKPSKTWYCAYKKCEGKNDNYSSFIFFHNIGDLKWAPEQYEIYATEFWYGDQASKISDKELQQKVKDLIRDLESSKFGYSLYKDANQFSNFAHDYPGTPRVKYRIEGSDVIQMRSDGTEGRFARIKDGKWYVLEEVMDAANNKHKLD
jgi:hypothetical protein